MRELKRSIAKARMREAGFTRLFKKTRVNGQKGESVFARQWRKFIGRGTKAKPSISWNMSKKKGQYWMKEPKNPNFRPMSHRVYGRGDGKIFTQMRAEGLI